MMKNIMLLFAIAILACSETKIKPENKIKKIIFSQQECWNNGDIDGFMNAYWNNDSLRFTGKNGITYGWSNTLNNYKKSYPNKAKMGQLTFTFEEIIIFSAVDAYVLGKWHLKRKKSTDLHGYFSLVWKKIDGSWVIISDHTS